ncbi:LUD domain-containing protein [Amycolatopsis sp. FDAARGOS 1241]|uniref:LutC/YkgG family protein n=1 Tax=Amycolatopsis sp. FDAARGOS 1241 TaxID=2778070 RepID=UPI0019526831|nr:LUD domain-containing protein [Amycolatopsis sp. FDAARGOS 1241]QRP49376.1 LUD domain-containing protein [Amycolatopsis sp. FDAARGOS 1241]
MTARDAILGAVRSALASADRADAAVPRGYRAVPAPADVVELFATRVVDYRATLTRCAPSDVPGVVRTTLGPARSVLVPDGFPYPVEGLPDADDLDTVDAVVTTAAVGIARTGTLVLDHGPGQGRRALTLVPDTHVCVLPTTRIVPGVPDAIDLLDPARPQTWISGPSATSDIELNRVEGVHGPRNLHVILVES